MTEKVINKPDFILVQQDTKAMDKNNKPIGRSGCGVVIAKGPSAHVQIGDRVMFCPLPGEWKRESIVEIHNSDLIIGG
jgi:threonine dehydrogenase-like Zn-dependent dehydrogenase